MHLSRGNTMGRALTQVVTVVAAMGLVAGCTGDPDPTPLGPGTASPTTPAATPTSTPASTQTTAPETIEPERPDAMDEISVEGAEAVAQYFLELYPYVYATADLSEWTRLSHAECIFCKSVVDNVTEQMNAGTHTIGGDVEVSSATGVEVDEDAWYSVKVRFKQLPSSEVDSAGEVVEQFPETKEFEGGIAVVVQDGTFVVRAVEPTRIDDGA